MTRVTFVDGPLHGQTRDMDVVHERLGDYYLVGLRYRYDPERRLGRVANRQCLECAIIWDDQEGELLVCPRCHGENTTDDEIRTVFRMTVFGPPTLEQMTGRRRQQRDR